MSPPQGGAWRSSPGARSESGLNEHERACPSPRRAGRGQPPDARQGRPTPQGLLVLVGSLLSPPFGDLTNVADGVRGTSPVSKRPRRRESLSGAVREGSISPEISGAESPAGQPSPAASVRGRAEPRRGADAAIGTWPAVRRDGSRQGVPTRGCRPPRAAPWAQRPPSLLGQAVPAGPCPPAAPGMGGIP